jgi:anti-anti-sigma factor
MAKALPTPFDVTATERDDLATVAVMRGLDCDTAPRLNQVFLSVADPGRVILVDLRQTEFMDFAGIAPLVTASRLQRELGGDLVLDSPGRAVSMVIERTQLNKLISVVGNTGPSESRVLGGRRAGMP